MGILLFFLLLMASLYSGHAQQGLECYSDMFQNITCRWDGMQQETDRLVEHRSKCTLTATKVNMQGHIDRDYPPYKCDLIKLDGNIRGCVLHIDSVDCFAAKLDWEIYDLTTTCENYTKPVAHLRGFNPPRRTVKLPPPEEPTIENATISWRHGPYSGLIKNYVFELQNRTHTQTWEEMEAIPICCKGTSGQLNEKELEKGRRYWARVRVRPEGFWGNCDWSDWSPVAFWDSAMGDSPDNDPAVETWLVWWAVIGAAAVLVFLLVIMFMGAQMRKSSLIPDPSKFFDGLDSVHKGNFKAWLGPFWTLETLSVERQSEMFSSVEVLKVQMSSSFNNIQYFYGPQDNIKHPPPLLANLEPCSEFSPYNDMKSDQGSRTKKDADMSKGNSSSGVTSSSSSSSSSRTIMDLRPIQMCSSYEDLARLRAGAQSPDSGFSGGSIEEESREESLEAGEQQNRHEPDEKTPLARSGGTFSIPKAPRSSKMPLKTELFLPMTSFSLLPPQPCALPSPGTVAPDLCSTPTGWFHKEDILARLYGELQPSSDDYMPLQT